MLGISFWLEGISASRKPAVHFKDKSDLADMLDTTPEAIRGTERALCISFKWMVQPLIIVNVYGPSLASERTDFLKTRHGGALVAADFNCDSGDLNVTPNASCRRRTGYLGDLQLLEETFGLVHVWRDQHPGERAIIHVCASDQSEPRLDRWLLSLDVLHVAQQSDIWEGLPGDHLGVTCGCRPSRTRAEPPSLDVPVTAPG